MRFKSVNICSLLLIGCFSFNSMSCKEENKKIKQVEVSFKKEGELTIYKTTTDSIIKKLDIEIADSEYETETGLMYRSSMKKNHGMLFVFPDMLPRSFYMKNTQFALDLIYIDDKNTIVSFQKNTKPFDESPLPSNAPVKYVLEINAGLVNEWNLNIGDRISY